MAEKALQKLLCKKFFPEHVNSAISHYQESIEKFYIGEWEHSIAKGSKFVEAILKALWAHAGETVPEGKDFKAGAIIDQLASKPAGALEDTVRLTMPRACRLLYDVASNRGGRHDSGQINPNQMDATLVVNTASWLLAEALRYSQEGALATHAATDLVTSLNQRKLPFVENINGRYYFSLKGLGAREVVLLTLWAAHPRRVSTQDLIAAAKRHGNSGANAKMGVSRVRRIADDDGRGNLLLLMSGVQEAEELISSRNKS